MAHVMLVASQLDGNHVSSHSVGSPQFVSTRVWLRAVPRQLTLPRATRLPHNNDAASLICINKHIIYILLHTDTHTYRHTIYTCDICVHISIRRVRECDYNGYSCQAHSYSFICFNVEWAATAAAAAGTIQSDVIRSDSDSDSVSKCFRLRLRVSVVVACLELGVIWRQATGP